MGPSREEEKVTNLVNSSSQPPRRTRGEKRKRGNEANAMNARETNEYLCLIRRKGGTRCFMEILNKLMKVVRHRPDCYPRGSPQPSGPGSQTRRRKAYPFVLLTMLLCVILSFATVAQAATSKTGVGTVTSNGVYTVIAIDEAGNRTIREITIDNIIPKETTDDEGNIIPDRDVTDTDEGSSIL